MPEPDCFLRYRINAATLTFTSGKSHVYVLGPAAAARRGFKMVLFTAPSEHLCRRRMRSTECPSSLSYFSTTAKKSNKSIGTFEDVSHKIKRLHFFAASCIDIRMALTTTDVSAPDARSISSNRGQLYKRRYTARRHKQPLKARL